jgi:hypothetical protein
MLCREYAHHQKTSRIDRQRGSSPHLAEEVLHHEVEEVGLTRLEGDGVLAVDLSVDVEPVGAAFGIGD